MSVTFLCVSLSLSLPLPLGASLQGGRKGMCASQVGERGAGPTARRAADHRPGGTGRWQGRPCCYHTGDVVVAASGGSIGGRVVQLGAQEEVVVAVFIRGGEEAAGGKEGDLRGRKARWGRERVERGSGRGGKAEKGILITIPRPTIREVTAQLAHSSSSFTFNHPRVAALT